MSEGASLIVFFAAECIPLNAQVYVHLGPTMFNGVHTVTHSTLPPIASGLNFAKHSRIGADGQVSFMSGSIGLVINPSCGLHASQETSDERTWIVNSLGNSFQIKGDGSPRNRDSDWNGYDGEPMNKLWDSHSDVIFDSKICRQRRTQLQREIPVARRLHRLGSAYSGHAMTTRLLLQIRRASAIGCASLHGPMSVHPRKNAAAVDIRLDVPN
jgi:hypothetical protein